MNHQKQEIHLSGAWLQRWEGGVRLAGIMPKLNHQHPSYWDIVLGLVGWLASLHGVWRKANVIIKNRRENTTTPKRKTGEKELVFCRGGSLVVSALV